jgi:DNA-binding NarL/FixJ family response regulator
MENHTGKFTIELVDDQELVRAGLALLIQSSAEMELVATASALDEAVRYAEQLRPRLILMDVLPDPMVFETARSLVQRLPGTRLVLLDEAPLDANIRESIRVGASGYLTKLQPFAQIEAALRLAARGDRVYAPEVARRLIFSAEGVRLGSDSPRALDRLTPREMDVLVNLARGNSVKQCAEVLGIGASTVGNHKSRLMKKLNVHKTVELVHLAVREGIVPGRPGPHGSTPQQL